MGNTARHRQKTKESETKRGVQRIEMTGNGARLAKNEKRETKRGGGGAGGNNAAKRENSGVTVRSNEKCGGRTRCARR